MRVGKKGTSQLYLKIDETNKVKINVKKYGKRKYNRNKKETWIKAKDLNYV